MSGPFPTKEVRDARRLRRSGIGPAAQAAVQEAIDQNKDDELKMAKAFRRVYATPDGQAVLEHIMTTLCMIDQPFGINAMADERVRDCRMVAFDLGQEVHRLIYRPIDERKEQPKVQTERQG